MMFSLKLTPTIAVAITLLLLIARGTTYAEESVLSGKVTSVTDGDTLTILDVEKVQHKVRLEGIDSPETGQAFGTQAKNALSERVFGKEVQVRVTGKDRYGRTLGHVYIEKEWVNRGLILDGHAWHFKKYSSDKNLADAELTARKDRSGLWKDQSPIAPWDYRKGITSAQPLAVAGAVMPPAGGTMVFVTKSGSKYHCEGCRSLAKSKLPISLEDARARFAPCAVCKPPR